LLGALVRGFVRRHIDCRVILYFFVHKHKVPGFKHCSSGSSSSSSSRFV